MKRYIVNLVANHEMHVTAENEEHAMEKAMEEIREYTETTDPNWEVDNVETE